MNVVKKLGLSSSKWIYGLYLEQPVQWGRWSLVASASLYLYLYLSDPGVPGVRSMGPVVSH